MSFSDRCVGIVAAASLVLAGCNTVGILPPPTPQSGAVPAAVAATAIADSSRARQVGAATATATAHSVAAQAPAVAPGSALGLGPALNTGASSSRPTIVLPPQEPQASVPAPLIAPASATPPAIATSTAPPPTKAPVATPTQPQPNVANAPANSAPLQPPIVAAGAPPQPAATATAAQAAPTSVPSATPLRLPSYPASRITIPSPGQRFESKAPPNVEWQSSSEALEALDYYAVTVQHAAGSDVRCHKGNFAPLPGYLPVLMPQGGFRVSVEIVRLAQPVDNGVVCAGTPVSPRSVPISFYWFER